MAQPRNAFSRRIYYNNQLGIDYYNISFTTIELPEKFAFIGAPKNSIVSIGTYGCIKSRENKNYFRKGLAAMLDELTPEVVLVYGGMPECIFGEFRDRTHFVNYPDWTSTKRRRAV